MHAAESSISGVLVLTTTCMGMSVVLRSQALGEAHAHVLAWVRVRVCASEEIVLEKQSDDANARRCHQLIAMRLEPEVVCPLLYIHPYFIIIKATLFHPKLSGLTVEVASSKGAEGRHRSAWVFR